MTPQEFIEKNHIGLKQRLESSRLRGSVTKLMLDFAKEYHTEQLILLNSSLTLEERYKTDFDFWVSKRFIQKEDLYKLKRGIRWMTINMVQAIYNDEVLSL